MGSSSLDLRAKGVSWSRLDFAPAAFVSFSSPSTPLSCLPLTRRRSSALGRGPASRCAFFYAIFVLFAAVSMPTTEGDGGGDGWIFAVSCAGNNSTLCNSALGIGSSFRKGTLLLTTSNHHMYNGIAAMFGGVTMALASDAAAVPQVNVRLCSSGRSGIYINHLTFATHFYNMTAAMIADESGGAIPMNISGRDSDLKLRYWPNLNVTYAIPITAPTPALRASPRDITRAYVKQDGDSKCDIFIGPQFSDAAISLSPLMEKPLWVDPAASSTLLSNKNQHPSFNRVTPSDNQCAPKVADVLDFFGWQSAYVIKGDTSYATSWAASFSTALIQYGGTIVETFTVQKFLVDEAALTAILFQIRDSPEKSRVVVVADISYDLLGEIVRKHDLDLHFTIFYSEVACSDPNYVAWAKVRGSFCLTTGFDADYHGRYIRSFNARDDTSTIATRPALVDEMGFTDAEIPTFHTGFAVYAGLAVDAAWYALAVLQKYQSLNGGRLPADSVTAANFARQSNVSIQGLSGIVSIDENGDRLGFVATLYNADMQNRTYTAGMADSLGGVQLNLAQIYILGKSYDLRGLSRDQVIALLPSDRIRDDISNNLNNNKNNNTSLDTGIIVAIVVAAAVILCAVLGLVVWRALALSRRRAGSFAAIQHAPKDPIASAAIIFTDIQSSTMLWAECPMEMSIALDLHNAVIRKCIAKHRGYEVKTIGDSFMIAFKDPLDAVLCSMDIQQDLYTAKWSSSNSVGGGGGGGRSGRVAARVMGSGLSSPRSDGAGPQLYDKATAAAGTPLFDADADEGEEMNLNTNNTDLLFKKGGVGAELSAEEGRIERAINNFYECTVEDVIVITDCDDEDDDYTRIGVVKGSSSLSPPPEVPSDSTSPHRNIAADHQHNRHDKNINNHSLVFRGAPHNGLRVRIGGSYGPLSIRVTVREPSGGARALTDAETANLLGLLAPSSPSFSSSALNNNKNKNNENSTSPPPPPPPIDATALDGFTLIDGLTHQPFTVEADALSFDYFGPFVNMAARIEGVGHGGQVIVTKALLDAAVGRAAAAAAAAVPPSGARSSSVAVSGVNGSGTAGGGGGPSVIGIRRKRSMAQQFSSSSSPSFSSPHQRAMVTMNAADVLIDLCDARIIANTPAAAEGPRHTKTNSISMNINNSGAIMMGTNSSNTILDTFLSVRSLGLVPLRGIAEPAALLQIAVPLTAGRVFPPLRLDRGGDDEGNANGYEEGSDAVDGATTTTTTTNNTATGVLSLAEGVDHHNHNVAYSSGDDAATKHNINANVTMPAASLAAAMRARAHRRKVQASLNAAACDKYFTDMSLIQQLGAREQLKQQKKRGAKKKRAAAGGGGSKGAAIAIGVGGVVDGDAYMYESALRTGYFMLDALLSVVPPREAQSLLRSLTQQWRVDAKGEAQGLVQYPPSMATLSSAATTTTAAVAATAVLAAGVDADDADGAVAVSSVDVAASDAVLTAPRKPSHLFPEGGEVVVSVFSDNDNNADGGDNNNGRSKKNSRCNSVVTSSHHHRSAAGGGNTATNSVGDDSSSSHGNNHNHIINSNLYELPQQQQQQQKQQYQKEGEIITSKSAVSAAVGGGRGGAQGRPATVSDGLRKILLASRFVPVAMARLDRAPRFSANSGATSNGTNTLMTSHHAHDNSCAANRHSSSPPRRDHGPLSVATPAVVSNSNAPLANNLSQQSVRGNANHDIDTFSQPERLQPQQLEQRGQCEVTSLHIPHNDDDDDDDLDGASGGHHQNGGNAL